MIWATADAYKVLLARAMMGEDVDLAPATIHVGDGASFTQDEPDPPLGTDAGLAHELTSAPIVPPIRASYTVTALGYVPGGASALTINEVAFKTAGGVMIARATFEPVTFQAPFNYEATLRLQPEL